MIVSSMTWEERRNEVVRDLIILRRKSHYVSKPLKRELHPKHLRPGIKKEIVKFYDWVSPHKNKWIYRIDATKKGALYKFMLYYYDEVRGLNAITIPESDTELMLFFTAHFFKRYNERNNLNLVKPEEIIRAFMNDNNNFQVKPLEETEPDVYKIFCVIQSGVALGTLNMKLKLHKMNTFITHQMLKKDQLEMEEQLKTELEKYKGGSAKLE